MQGTPPSDGRLAALVQSAAQALKGRCAVPEGTPVIAACSGGADSVALVAALSELSGRWPLAGVAFVDHGLRDVAAERACASAAATRAAVPFVDRLADLSGAGSVQDAARQARYRILGEVAEDVGPTAVIATGHTLNDQAETVIQRLTRGAGLRGLGAIGWRTGRSVRPLLGVSRSATRALGLGYADDPTNETGAYQRNRIRHEVLPRLVAENPHALSTIAETANHVQDALALIDALVLALPIKDANHADLPLGVAETLIRWRSRLEPAGASPSSGAVALLAQQLVDGRSRGRVDMGGGVEARANRGRLTFGKTHDPRTEVVVPGAGTYRLGTLPLMVSVGGDLNLSTPSQTEVLSVSSPSPIRWPLTIRRRTARERRAGDLRMATGDALQNQRFGDEVDGIRGPVDDFMITDGAGERLPSVHTQASHEPTTSLLVRLFAGLRPMPQKR
ncbi:MAG: tRNA(Ile)-lysidine synthase [Myxococcota bacterium]|jgi:tRNA(Ile)-lysidine synthase